MALIYCDIIITAVRTVSKAVIEVEQNDTWQRLKIHAVPLVRYMGKGTEGLQLTWDEMHTETEGVTVPVHGQCLASPHSIQARRPEGETSASSAVFVVMWSKVARRLVQDGNQAAGLWY